MKVEIFQQTDRDILVHQLNRFDDEHNVKFTQHSTCGTTDGNVVITAIVFYED